MSDLIKRCDAMYAIRECGICEQRILDVPSAEPEIIRCKNCKYHDERQRDTATMWLPCMNVQTENNWFCGSAERKD